MLYADFKNIWKSYMEMKENIIKYTNEKYIRDLNKRLCLDVSQNIM